MIDYMFSGAAGFTAPAAIFNANPNTYVSTAVPATDVLSGTITPNNGTIVSWSITAGTNSTPIATGTGINVTHTLNGANVPTTIGTHTYYLTVTYTDNNNATQSFVVATNIIVTAAARFGQLAGPTDNITTPAGLTPAIEATLTTTSKGVMINLFSVTAANTGRIVFVVPDSYGTVSSIEDGAGLNVLNQFNVVVDAGNNRRIYVSINTVVPGSYDYKFIF